MATVSDPDQGSFGAAADDLRETIETLAAIERAPNSPGERTAAEWLRERLEQLGCRAAIEEERSFDSFAPAMARLTALGAVGGLAALTERGRLPGAALAAAAVALIADDISNGARLFRRATMKPTPTWNVVAEAGDLEADRTLVVLAHHDAAPTGRIFDPSFQRWLGETFPGVVERIDTGLPQWWTVIAGPGSVVLGATRRRQRLVVTGTVLSLLATAAFADIARSPTVPGANDNLSGVAVLVALARALQERRLDGLRLLLVSCGSEEVLQGGIRGFAARHFPSLDRERTWVVNVDSVASPRLVMLEGEGTLVMEDYCDRTFRDLVASVADRAGITLRRGMRARSSTDSVIPSRAGLPTTTLVSVDRHKLISNYHLMSDIPENVDYGTVASAAALTEAVARELPSRQS